MPSVRYIERMHTPDNATPANRLEAIRARLAECHDGPDPKADADFIAHAPDDIAWLLAEVERLREWGDGWQRGFFAYERKFGSVLTMEDLNE